MPCNPDLLQEIPLFSLLDAEERNVLAEQVELKNFAARQRIYKQGEAGGRGYVLVSGAVRVTTIDADHQEVLVEEPAAGDFFGFASMLDGTPHQTDAAASEDTVCIEVDNDDILALIRQRPHAGLDLLVATGRRLHAAHELVRVRSARNPNEVIDEEMTFGQRIADGVARFGGSWSFIITFGAVLVVYSGANIVLGKQAWDPYPFILLNLFLSMLAAIQAPVIMMSQNRQDEKDRVRGELDFEVNRRAESEIKSLSQKLHLLGRQMGDIEDLLRESAGRGSDSHSTVR
jgi:CRP/FNR family transcriptional regulator, cyclic AMP receptor protein